METGIINSAEDDFYTRNTLSDSLEDDEISAEEEGFMFGYLSSQAF